MKKILIVLSVLFFAIACEKESDFELSKTDVVGWWSVTKVTYEGKTTDLQAGDFVVILSNDGEYIVNFLDDNYVGTYTIDGNTVVGITLVFIMEIFEFTSLSGYKAKINYKNSVGDSYKFEAVKS